MTQPHRARRTAPIAVALLLLLTTAALAAAVKSGTYKGTLTAPRTEYTVSLTLKGSKLSAVKLNNIPFFCSSGGPPVPASFPKGTISAHGSFSLKDNNKIKVGPLKGKIGEKLTLVGTFTTHNTVNGTLKVVVVNAHQCNGSIGFTARRR